ncbi:helix-turn-helix domain-containing protein [Sphaerisporangium sp. NPDC005289]|uniref:MmyB family transcriptional regulator n=1 Tax=Sphaerisporangium sp. NPDC005289 TaxID=3155247 RepID=UPI0033A86FBF
MSSAPTGPADRADLGAALRHWRDRLPPGEVGLPSGGVRRAPGLRREELAQLAGLSVDYVVRLERGRATSPSAQVLTALSRALRLSVSERDHLYLLDSRRFGELWAAHAVGRYGIGDTKVVHHPDVGAVTVDCDVLTVPGSDLRIVVYSAPPGTTTAAQFELLNVVGTQRMTSRRPT